MPVLTGIEHKRKQQREYYAANREQILAKRRTNYHKHREKNAARSLAHYHANSDKYSARHRERKYGITQEEYDALFSAQGYTCAICGTDDPKSKNPWHLDHCHSTGKVRGILCHHCNCLLGWANDDIAKLRRAHAYLTGA